MLGHGGFSSTPFQFHLNQEFALKTLCYRQGNKIPPPPRKKNYQLNAPLLANYWTNKDLHTFGLTLLTFCSPVTFDRLAVALSSSSEGRNSRLCTTTNHTDCVLSFSQADKAFRSVTSCKKFWGKILCGSLALSLSRSGPSLPTPATFHQVRRIPYLCTSLRT